MGRVGAARVLGNINWPELPEGGADAHTHTQTHTHTHKTHTHTHTLERLCITQHLQAWPYTQAAVPLSFSILFSLSPSPSTSPALSLLLCSLPPSDPHFLLRPFSHLSLLTPPLSFLPLSVSVCLCVCVCVCVS